MKFSKKTDKMKIKKLENKYLEVDVTTVSESTLSAPSSSNSQTDIQESLQTTECTHKWLNNLLH